MGPVRLIESLCVSRSLFPPPPVDFTPVCNDACAHELELFIMYRPQCYVFTWSVKWMFLVFRRIT